MEEQEKVLPAAHTQPSACPDRFWVSRRTGQKGKRKGRNGSWSTGRKTQPQLAEQAEKSRRRPLESHKKWKSEREGVS